MERGLQALETSRCRVTRPSRHGDSTGGKKAGGEAGGRRTMCEKIAFPPVRTLNNWHAAQNRPGRTATAPDEFRVDYSR
jgi:hypothetical protein